MIGGDAVLGVKSSEEFTELIKDIKSVRQNSTCSKSQEENTPGQNENIKAHKVKDTLPPKK